MPELPDTYPLGEELTAEAEARAMLTRIGVEGAEDFSAGDLVELANLLDWRREILKWQAEGERLNRTAFRGSLMFSLGGWWADRPWRKV